MGEGQGIALVQMVLDVLLVGLGLDAIGDRDRDDVGFLSGGVYMADLEPGRRPTRTSQPESFRFSACAWP